MQSFQLANYIMTVRRFLSRWSKGAQVYRLRALPVTEEGVDQRVVIGSGIRFPSSTTIDSQKRAPGWWLNLTSQNALMSKPLHMQIKKRCTPVG